MEGDEVVPSIIIFKAKVTSLQFLDKLKVRCVVRGYCIPQMTQMFFGHSLCILLKPLNYLWQKQSDTTDQ